MAANPVPELPNTLTAAPRYFDNNTLAKFFQPANRTIVTTTVVTTAATSTGPFGFATAAQADAVVAQVNLFYTALKSAGIIDTTTVTTV